MGPAIVTRNELLASLRGRTLEIPDLQALLSHWPQYVHLELDRLRKDVDRKLHELFPEGKRLDKIKAADAGLFAASWWPYAPYEALKIATFLSIWLFVWDDELDSSEFSSLVLDYDRARSFRTETLEYAQRYLITNEHTITTKATTDVIIASFKPVAVAISESCSPAQIKTFMEEMRFFVDMTDVEQQVQMSMKLPSLEEYRQRRMGSSAVRMCLAITEYCFGMEIPRTVIDDDDMRVIWNETNVIISTMNDLLSVRKEIMQCQVDSLIPLLYAQQGSLEATVKEVVKTLEASVLGFETSAKRLLARYFADPELHHNIQRFIHGCQCACTANLNWSVGSGRYKLGTRSLHGGTQVVL